MAETTNMNPEEEKVFDPLDMNNYKVEKLPKMQKSGFERWMARLGGPLAILVFVLIYWFADFSFLNNITEEGLTGDKAIKRLKDVGGLVEFIRINYAMLAIFAAAIVLWVSEAIPSYLTSLLVILGVVLTGVAPQKEAFAQLGHPVMWLNILSFVLASMLVKTRVAKRFALWFVLRFGRNATGVFFSFIIINLVLSMFISATAVKASILLPIFMVVAAIYGAGNGVRNNFGRNLVLQNLLAVNVGASGFMTGAGAHLLAISLIAGVVGGYTISYTEWLYAALPMAILVLIIGWFVGTKLIFPMKKEEQKPQIEGGMERLQNELKAMGKVTFEEIKAVLIFVGVLVLWVTKKWHGIDETTVAFIGAVVALMPKIGIVKWNDVDIPWHLMLFSAGAYALGTGLNATDLHTTLVNTAYDALGITAQTPFWVIYVVLTGLMMFSGLIFSSKTMRTMIFVPIAIATAQKFGYPIMSLAFPVALLIDHVYVLPFNSKPAALLYTTNHYSWSDTFKYGITMMGIAWVLIILWGQTVLHWLGHTPGLF
jgi:anion transporter